MLKYYYKAIHIYVHVSIHIHTYTYTHTHTHTDTHTHTHIPSGRRSTDLPLSEHIARGRVVVVYENISDCRKRANLVRLADARI